jgi:hypothetical protein
MGKGLKGVRKRPNDSRGKTFLADARPGAKD